MAQAPGLRDPRGVLFSEKLLGLEHDCDMRHCSELEVSTGWLFYDPAIREWFVSFHCARHGLGGRWSPVLRPLVGEVLLDAKRRGVDIDAIIAAPSQPDGDGAEQPSKS